MIPISWIAPQMQGSLSLVVTFEIDGILTIELMITFDDIHKKKVMSQTHDFGE